MANRDPVIGHLNSPRNLYLVLQSLLTYVRRDLLTTRVLELNYTWQLEKWPLAKARSGLQTKATLRKYGQTKATLITRDGLTCVGKCGQIQLHSK